MESPRARGQPQQWTDDEMLDMVDKINQGFTYQDVTDGTHVPISTLWTRVKGMYHGQVRPKTGAPCMFSKEVEEDIALFLKHCTFLRVPRTKTMLRDDILHYVQYKQLDVPRMPEDGPCHSFLDRFAQDWKEIVKFHTKTEIFQIQNDPITMKDWVFERDNYTRIQLLTKYFSSRQYIFVMEVETLRIEASNTVEFPVIIAYNAEGELMIPFVPHLHGFSPVVTTHFKNRINFFPTEDGKLDRNCMCILIYLVNLVMINGHLKEPPIIYFAPELAKHISLFMWDIANRHNFVIQTIPHNIYWYFKTANMGVFEKLTPKFKHLAKERFQDKSSVCLKFHFLDILRQVMEEGRWGAHLRNSCRRLRIVHVSPEIAQVEEEIVIEDD